MTTKARKLMPDDPITFATLMQYHREVLLPDVQRLVDTAIDTAVGGLRNEMHAGFDAVYQRLDRLETEYHMLVAGLKRVEERLDMVEDRLGSVERGLSAVEQKLDKVALRSELWELKARVDNLQAQVRALEERLSA